MIERCIRCNEKLLESSLDGYRERFYRERTRHDGVDDEFLHRDPHGRVILWLRCSVCMQERPTTRVWRTTPFDPYLADREARGQHQRPGGQTSYPPTEPRASRTSDPPEREALPWWAEALGITRMPRDRRAALRVVKTRWRVAVRTHHADRKPAGPGHHEAFLRKRAAYEAALAELQG